MARQLKRVHGAKAARGANGGDRTEAEHADELNRDAGRDIDQLSGTVSRRAWCLYGDG